MKVTMADVAQAAGVSVSTVSRALSHDKARPVSSETAERILNAAVSLGYLCSTGAEPGSFQKSSESPRTLTCLLASYFDKYSDYFFTQMLGGINEEATRLGYRLTHSFAISQTNLEQIKTQITETRFDGLILLGRYDTQALDFLRGRTDNIIYAGLNRLDIGIDEVICDAYGAISALTDHLIRQGNRHIAYVGTIPEQRGNIVNEHRYRAFCDTMKLASMAIDPDICVDINPGMDTGYCAALHLVSLKNPPDAICCANDTIAIGVISGLRDCGIRIPDTIAVVGMGMDNPEITNYMVPKLTSANMQMREIGRFAVKILDDRIRGLHVMPVLTTLPYDLVIRDSSVRMDSRSSSA